MDLKKTESFSSFIRPMGLLNQEVHTKRSKSNNSAKEKKGRTVDPILEPTISEIVSRVNGTTSPYQAKLTRNRNINLSIDRLGSNIN